MTKVNERFIWAAELLDLKPDDNVLEIGCGTGILIEQMAKKLLTGSIIGIDRSASMIRLAEKRNRYLLNAGKASFINSAFSAVKGNSTYDKIVAFNVNFFWKDARAELLLIRNLLRSNGKLYVFYQAPYDITIEAADPVKDKLIANTFVIADTVFKKMVPASAFCIVARSDKV